MKPLVIVFSNLGLGGIQKKIVDIVNTLAKTNPDLPVYILLRRYDIFDFSDKIKNPKVNIIIYTDWAKVKTPFFFTFFTLYYIWKLKPSAVLSFLSPFSIPVLLTKTLLFWRKMVVVVNEDHFTSGIVPHLRYSTLNRWGIKLFYPKANMVISPTKVAKRDLMRNYKIPARKIIVVPNWANVSGEKSKIKTYDFIYTGRLVKTKRVDKLFKVISELKKHKKDVSLCIAGGGEERNRLENLAKKIGIERNVEFIGTVVDIEKYLTKSRVFVSYTSYGAEGFPLSILEAMAIGIPVLTFRFAGANEVFEDGKNGFLFRSTNEFIEKALLLIQNSTKRKELASLARAKALSDHSVDNIDSYLAVLNV